MSKLNTEVAKLNEQDTYSLMMFALFKLRSIPEYATLSEMIYILDKESVLKLCEYFGGLTISIPTIEELESIVYSLILYQYVDIDGMEYSDAVEQLGHDSGDLRKVKADYERISKILKQYNFDRGSSYGVK